jgi:hypothetical protein
MNQENLLPNKYRALLTLIVVLICCSFIFSAGYYFSSKRNSSVKTFTESQKTFLLDRTEKIKSIIIKEDSVKIMKANEANFKELLFISKEVYQREYQKLLQATKDSSKANIEALKKICDNRISVQDSLMGIMFKNINYRDSLIADMKCLQISDSLQLNRNLLALDSIETSNKKLTEQVDLINKKGKLKFWIGLGTGIIVGEMTKSLFN